MLCLQRTVLCDADVLILIAFHPIIVDIDQSVKNGCLEVRAILRSVLDGLCSCKSTTDVWRDSRTCLTSSQRFPYWHTSRCQQWGFILFGNIRVGHFRPSQYALTTIIGGEAGERPVHHRLNDTSKPCHQSADGVAPQS